MRISYWSSDVGSSDLNAGQEHTLFQCFDHAGHAAQPLGAGLERTDAGQHDPPGLANEFGVIGNAHLCAAKPQRIVHRMEIARAVIHEGKKFSNPIDQIEKATTRASECSEE